MTKQKQPVQPEQAQLPDLDPSALPSETPDNGEQEAAKRTRSMGKVTVMQVIDASVISRLVEAGGGKPDKERINDLMDFGEFLSPIADVPELNGVPEAQKWLKEAMERQDVGGGSYVIVRLAKRIDAEVKQTVSVDFTETDF